MFDLKVKLPNKVEQTGSTLGLYEIRTADTPPVHIIRTQAGSQFFSSHPFPVPAAGLIPKPSDVKSLILLQSYVEHT